MNDIISRLASGEVDALAQVKDIFAMAARLKKDECVDLLVGALSVDTGKDVWSVALAVLDEYPGPHPGAFKAPLVRLLNADLSDWEVGLAISVISNSRPEQNSFLRAVRCP